MRRLTLLAPLAVLPLLLAAISMSPAKGEVSWFEPDMTNIEECASDNISCLSQAFANIAYQEGGRRALDRLVSETVSGSTLDIECHKVVHSIGGAVYARTLEIGPAFTEGGAECGYGFYHGVVEQAFSRDGIDPRAAAKSCATLTDIDERDQCSHGAGHAFGSQGSPSETAARCEDFGAADASVSRESCYAGAFMEGFIGALGPPRWIEGASACKELPSTIRASCYGQAAVARLSDPERGGWEYAADGCKDLLGLDRDGCVEGWSSQLAGRSGWQELCALAGAQAELCAVTAGEMEAVFRMPDPAVAVDNCEREFLTDEQLVIACARGVGRRVDRSLCDRFSNPLATDACRQEE